MEDNTDDVDTRDKQKPHYGMGNLNSRQEIERGKEKVLLQKQRRNKAKRGKKTTRIDLGRRGRGIREISRAIDLTA